MEDYKNTICSVNDKDDVLMSRDYSVTSLPAILDGELFRVIERNGLKISAKCCNCPGEKIILGTKTSTGNFLSHIKRVHPTLLEKARNKRTRVGLRKWPEVSVSSQDNVPLFLTGNNSNISQNEADNVIVNYIVSDMNPLSVMEKSSKNFTKEFSKGSNYIVPSQKNVYSRNGSLWKQTTGKILPPEKNSNELRKRLLKLKREYYEIKRYLKFNNHPEWKYIKSVNQSASHPNHIQEKKCDLDSLEVEIDTKHVSDMPRNYTEDKRNTEDSIEQSISEFQRTIPEDLRNPEDNLEFEIGQMPEMLRSTDETIICNSVEGNTSVGREPDSPSTSTSQLSDVLFSTSSTSTDEEKHSSPSNKKSKILKIKGKYKNHKLFEAEKKSYELKWKKLQMEIEVAQSMKTLITSLADLVSRIQPPFSGQSSAVPNWTMPSPYSFVQNYPQPMPSSPVSQQCVCNNRKSSQSINGIPSSNQSYVNHSKDSTFNDIHNNGINENT